MIRGQTSLSIVCGLGKELPVSIISYALCAHDTRNAVAVSWTAKHLSQLRAAIGLTTADKGFSNALAQLHVLHLSRSWFAVPLFPVVVAAARDQQCFT